MKGTFPLAFWTPYGSQRGEGGVLGRVPTGASAQLTRPPFQAQAGLPAASPCAVGRAVGDSHGDPVEL